MLEVRVFHVVFSLAVHILHVPEISRQLLHTRKPQTGHSSTSTFSVPRAGAREVELSSSYIRLLFYILWSNTFCCRRRFRKVSARVCKNKDGLAQVEPPRPDLPFLPASLNVSVWRTNPSSLEGPCLEPTDFLCMYNLYLLDRLS